MIKPAPGFELDCAVAEAIGWRYTQKIVVRNQFDEVAGTSLQGWWDGDEYVSYETPKFSTDLNAAFAAAETVGLFDRLRTRAMLYQVYRQNEDETWCVHWRHPGEQSTFGATPALAICAAILKAQS